MRPVYESRGDLDNEQQFVEWMFTRHGAGAIKLPVSYGVDFLIQSTHDHDVWLEFKRRHHTRGTYPDVILSALKWEKGTSLARATNMAFVFAVQFDDVLAAAHFDPVSPWYPDVDYGGRTRNTRDSADIEPVVRIPIEQFYAL